MNSTPPEESKPQPAESTQPPSADLPFATKSKLSRYVSFGLLLGVIVLVGFVFYEVMASFLVPLFLAALLVVVFRPLHRRILDRCQGRQKMASLLTTASILLVVLIPLSALFFLAAIEGREAIAHFNSRKVIEGVHKIRSNFRLDMPAAGNIRSIENMLAEMQDSGVLNDEEIDRHRSSLFDIEERAKDLSVEANLEWPDDIIQASPDSLEKTDSKDSKSKNSKSSDSKSSDSELEDSELEDSELEDSELEDSELEDSELAPSSVVDLDTDPLSNIDPKDDWALFLASLEHARSLHSPTSLSRADDEDEQKSQSRLEKTREYRNWLNKTAAHFSKFKSKLLGGKTKAFLVELVNPSDEEFAAYWATGIRYLRDKLFKIGGGAASFLGSTLLGFAIMIIGLYFFLIDGPKMIESFKGLSPLDDDHEQELVSEFGKVSRAVVVATLLSALVQGLLAGVGFYFSGLESIFLLTVLSAVLAMVPFVGAAAVWVPCCLYLYFFENQMGAAIGLAIYGVLVISMADNVIKPYVLHGQSNLHPLLALLSVLGGVATLGPIGILVGPMIVAFLQTLLKILQREMTQFELEEAQDALDAQKV